MGTDVASFARQLKEDGIEAAKKEADKLIEAARAKAKEIQDEAKASISRMEKEAQEQIDRDRKKAEADLKLVGRDLVLGVRKTIEETAAALLKQSVSKALSTEDTVKTGLLELLKTQKTGREWELALGPTVGKKLATTVVEDLFKQAGALAKLKSALEKEGFQLTSKGGTEVIEVTEDSVVEAFRRLLSPELAIILGQKTPAAR